MGTASSVAKRLGLSNANVLYRWKSEQLAQSGPVASALEVVRELETELRRVERERDRWSAATSDGDLCRYGNNGFRKNYFRQRTLSIFA